MAESRRALCASAVAVVVLVAGCSSGGGSRASGTTTSALTSSSLATTTQSGVSRTTLNALTPTTRLAVVVASTTTLIETREQPCTATDLAFEYFGGGAGAGNDVGTVRIRDTSAQPCLLRGSIVVSGTDRTGKVVTQTVAYPTAPDLFLTPNTPPLPNMQPPPTSEVVADLQMWAEYRDDNTSRDGLCHTPNIVVPAYWRLTFPDGSRVVPNVSHDPDPQWPNLLTCRGEIDTPSHIYSAATGF